MNRRYLDIAFLIMLAVIVAIHALISALGGDWSSVLFSAVGFAIVAALSGAMILERRLRAGLRSWPIGFALAACFAMLIATSATSWPLHAVFKWSRPELERLAAQVRAGDPVETPTRVGPFVVRRAELKDDDVYLWTGLHPAGDRGFAEWSGRAAPHGFWSQVDLADGWHFVSED